MDEAEYCTQVGIMREGRLLALDEPARLKAALPGQVWEIYADPLLDALEIVEQLPLVTRAGLASDHLRASVTEGGADLLRTVLAAQGIRIHAITPGTPSMEDVFMALSG
jgi:ABC-2 type transport system ATP-binding protein